MPNPPDPRIPGPGGGPPTPGDSRNFSGVSGVREGNHEPPVQTSAAGVTAAPEFTDFMRCHQNMVFSTAARLTGNHAQAEDIAQEVFLRAYRNFSHLAASPAAGGWLRTVATNLSLNHLSRYRRRWRFFSELRRADDDGESPAVEFPSTDDFLATIEAEERHRLVEDALASLPGHQRVPLVLFHFEDMPYDEIARRLGVSLAKVKTDILRGRAALAATLSRRGAVREGLTLPPQ